MGLVNGGLNARRFRIDRVGDPPTHALVLDQARAAAFVDCDTAADPEPRLGWVSVFDPACAALELNDVSVDRYLVLSLRADTKKVQATWAKIALTRRLAEVCAEKGVERLSKAEAEVVEEALTADLLRRALPSVATTDLAWDVDAGALTVFATSEGPLEQVRQLCKDSFGIALRPERTVDWLLDKLPAAEIATRMGALPGGPAAGDDPLAGNELGLASDFLVWLWLQSESTDGLFRVIEARPAIASATSGDPDTGWDDVTESLKHGSVTLWLDSRLKLRELAEEDPSTTILLGAAPAATPEARRTLSGGKRPVEATVGLKINDLECTLVLQATEDGVRASGLKAPFAVKDGREEKLLERVLLLDLVHGTVVKLYQQFFLARTSPAWQERVDAWLAEDPDAASSAEASAAAK